MYRWLKRYGFACLVSAALACAGHLAGSAAVPEPVPDYALQAEEIYRLEIGAAFFIAFYLAAMALVLAFTGRGFAELGTRGLKAGQVVDPAANGRQQEALSRQMKAIQRMERKLKELHAQVENLQRR